MKDKQRAIMVWVGLVAMVSALIWFPVWWGFIRLGIIVGSLGLWFGGLYIVWNNKTVRIGLIIITLFLPIMIFLPGNDGDPAKVSAVYVEKLKSYEGVKYVWGGKNARGIDCAGLVRKGYIDANVSLAIKTGNPKLLRRAFAVWWYDCAADALGEGYRNMTRKIVDAGSITELASSLQPGDLIVGLPGGFHVLAYLGNNQFIEADPTLGKVVTITATQKAEQWGGVPVRLVRWNYQL